MYCPECETEYREGIRNCSDCDVALVDELTAEKDQDLGLVPLTISTSSEFVAELIEALEEAEVPYVIQAGTALPLFDGEPELHSLRWQARIIVSRDSSEDAESIMEKVRDRITIRDQSPPRHSD